jgi:hypothetical protein
MLSKIFLTGALVLGFLSPAFGNAAVKQKVKKPLTEPQSVSNKQLRDALHTLHSVKKTLEAADHDYGGHKAAAIRDVSAAAHQLKLALEHVHKKKPTGTVKPGKRPGQKGQSQPEPQVLSDMQLANSVPVLKTTIDVLNQADHDYGGHRAKAVTDLQAAIVQLDKAIAFSKKHNANKP